MARPGTNVTGTSRLDAARVLLTQWYPLGCVTVLELRSAATPSSTFGSLRRWGPRQVLVSLVAALAIALVIGLPTDVIPNPVFGRPVPVTWWSYPTLLLTALLGGLLAAPTLGLPHASPPPPPSEIDTPTRTAVWPGSCRSSPSVVRCATVIVALGTTGARQWFEPTPGGRLDRAARMGGAVPAPFGGVLPDRLTSTPAERRHVRRSIWTSNPLAAQTSSNSRISMSGLDGLSGDANRDSALPRSPCSQRRAGEIRTPDLLSPRQAR
jgi:hypothetical protein